MRINVCINGTFRYPTYVKHYAERGVLNAYYYAHRISTNAGRLALPPEATFNFWWKEYALHASLRVLRPRTDSGLTTFFGDFWQRAVISQWRECDSVEAVIGEVADRVFQHAKKTGTQTVGHPVNSHPGTFSEIMNTEYSRLGLRWPTLRTSERRLKEIELCDQLIVDSKFVANSFVDHGFDRNKISIIRPGSDSKLFSPRSNDEVDRNVFRVVSVGAVSPRKGHRYLLEAWDKLKLRNAELIIVGATTNATSAIIRGYEGSFTHIEKVANAKLRPLLASATVFVLPSVEDGYSQAAVEALSCGVATIVTENNGVADTVANGDNGYVVRSADACALAERLQQLYDDRDLAFNIGHRAAASAALLDWKHYVDQVIAAHQGRHRRRAA